MRHHMSTAVLTLAAAIGQTGCIIFTWPDWDDCANPADDNCYNCGDDMTCDDDWVDDQDGDGVFDDDEVLCGTDPASYDTDYDGVGDGREDSDCDGHSNAREIELGTDCGNADERPAGGPDCDDVCDWPNDDDQDDEDDDSDRDLDSDGLTDTEELICGTDPGWQDTDHDGFDDTMEDSDCDGHSNGREVALGTDCGDANDHPGGTGDVGSCDGGPVDSDGDGVSDEDEVERGTDPDDADTDDDGDCDGAEIECGSSPLDPMFTCL